MREKSQEWPKNEVFKVFGKNLIHSMFFLLKYESAYGLLTFWKNNIFLKNLVLELWFKNLKTNQNAGFFELQYLTN